MAALHVARSDGLAGADPALLARQRVLVESLGGTYHHVVGDDIPTALLEFARGVNATQLVLGAAGADDYVTRPFGIDELLARIRAVTRRTATTGATAPAVHIGGTTVDLASHLVRAADGTEIRLTTTEWHLLEILARNPGKLVSQRQLLHDVWGPQYQRETHYLRQYMARLRRKLEPDPTRPRHFLTEPGMGYRFQPSDANTQ